MIAHSKLMKFKHHRFQLSPQPTIHMLICIQFPRFQFYIWQHFKIRIWRFHDPNLWSRRGTVSSSSWKPGGTSWEQTGPFHQCQLEGPLPNVMETVLQWKSHVPGHCFIFSLSSDIPVFPLSHEYLNAFSFTIYSWIYPGPMTPVKVTINQEGWRCPLKIEQLTIWLWVGLGYTLYTQYSYSYIHLSQISHLNTFENNKNPEKFVQANLPITEALCFRGITTSNPRLPLEDWQHPAIAWRMPGLEVFWGTLRLELTYP